MGVPPLPLLLLLLLLPLAPLSLLLPLLLLRLTTATATATASAVIRRAATVITAVIHNVICVVIVAVSVTRREE